MLKTVRTKSRGWKRCSLLLPLLVAEVTLYNCPATAEYVFTQSQFLTRFKDSVAPQNSGYFVPFMDAVAELHFESMTEALLQDDLAGAEVELEALEGLGITYGLFRLRNTPFPVRGFFELALPGDSDYKGWGAVVVNPLSSGYTVYEAPHVQYEAFTDDIAVEALVTNPYSVALILAGANRLANPDADGDGWPDADVAHDPHSLFNALHHHLAMRGISLFTPYWFIQIHGATDREIEPTVTGSNGDALPQMTEFHRLAKIDEAVDIQGLISMGVWGWWEGPNDDEDGRYALNGVINIQGDLLGFLGWRDSFMHLEIERQARDEYHAGVSPGYQGILGLLDTIATELVFGPATYVTQSPTATIPGLITLTPTLTPSPTLSPAPIPTLHDTSQLIVLLSLGILLSLKRVAHQ